MTALRLWQHYLLASYHLCLLFYEKRFFLPWWEHEWFQLWRLDLTSEDCVLISAKRFLIGKLSCCKPALVFLSFSVDSCLILGRFAETVIEERRQCAEDLLQFSANIPALYHSKQLEEFFKVCCSFWNILYLIKCFYFLICSKARFKFFFFFPKQNVIYF